MSRDVTEVTKWAMVELIRRAPNSESNPHSSSSFPRISLFFVPLSFVEYPLSSFLWIFSRTVFVRKGKSENRRALLSTVTSRRCQCSCTVVIPKEYIRP